MGDHARGAVVRLSSLLRNLFVSAFFCVFRFQSFTWRGSRWFAAVELRTCVTTDSHFYSPDFFVIVSCSYLFPVL